MKLKINLIKYFANLQFAISILILIAILSILGTIIEQEQTVSFYKENYPQKLFNIAIWKFILQIGLDHIFQTNWFLFTLFSLATSLSCCTFLQQFPILNKAQKYFFYTKNIQYLRLPFNNIIQSNSDGNLINQLQIRNYTVYQQKNIFYGYKGLVGRVAPIIVHLSLLIILIGTFIGSITGFTAQELIPKTETFKTQNLIKTNIFTFVPSTNIRINDFWITYKKDGIINQFYSDISLLNNNGLELKRKTIAVNNPLQYNHINYYQTDWNIIGLRIKIDNQLYYQTPYLNPSTKQKEIWYSWLPESNGASILINNLRGINTAYTGSGTFLSYFDMGEKYSLNSHIFQPIEFITTTGLQIRADPSIEIIYFGFGLLMFSVFISYKSFSQIWFRKKKKIIFIGGQTNRAQINFEKEILNIVLSIKSNKLRAERLELSQ